MSRNRHAQQHDLPAAQTCCPSGFTVEPPIGAHLATPRERYTHHGIYVGHGNVIHYAGFSRSWHAGPIEEVNVIEFAFGHPLRIVEHLHTQYSAQQIVQRARSRLGEHAFHLLSNNCEHFCNWCISGHHRSAQVERFAPVASLLLRSKIAKFPVHMPEQGETDWGVRPSLYGTAPRQPARPTSRSFKALSGSSVALRGAATALTVPNSDSTPKEKRMRRSGPATWHAVITTAVCAAMLAPLAGAAPRQDRYRAIVQRTSFGIPHVKANDFGSLGYGYGYAFAQDNFCVLADRIVTVNAQRSFYFGEAGNLSGDFFYKYIEDETKLRTLLNNSPSEVQALIKGYAAGYNRYLRETGADNLPTKCRGAAWVRPIDDFDLMRVYYALTLRASSENQLAAIVAAQPPVTSLAVAAKRPAAAIDIAAFQRPETLAIGSNAVALGRQATESGHGMLLGNPHFPWQGTERFYEVHLTIPGQLDVMGASLFGVPVVNIGFNKDVAWSHTVSTAFRFTPYALKLAPGDPTAYLYDGQTRQMTRQIVTVEARQADGTIVPRSHVFYRTHFGPLLVNPALGFVWSATTAYAMRDANADNGRFLEQFLRLNRAESVFEIQRALGEVLGLPWVNTIAADRYGNAFYADVSVVPNVNAAKIAQCVNSPVGQFIYQAVGLPVLDGSTSTCEWGIDPAAPQAGIFSINDMPTLIRHDYVTNSNDSYWLANPNQPLTGFSPIIGREGTVRSLRTRLGLRLVHDRLSGSDGLGGNLFSLEKLQTTTFNDRNYGGELVVTALVAACGSSVTLPDGSVVDLTQACSVLSSWDRKVNLDSVGAHVFREFWSRAVSIPNLYAVPFDINDPVNTPNTLNVGNPTVLLNVRQALGSAVKALTASGIPLDRAWGDVQYVVRNGTKIPIHGGAGGEGVFNVITSAGLSPAGYAEVVHGTSYIQTVTFDDTGPVAQALLTYSESTDPGSPHYADQTPRYSEKQWIPLPFQQGEISSDRSFTRRAINE